MFSGSQEYVEIDSNVDRKLVHSQIEDDEAFVLELEDYFDKNKSDLKTEGISVDISTYQDQLTR